MAGPKMVEVTFIRDKVQPSTQLGTLARAGDKVSVPKEEAALYVKRGWAREDKPSASKEAGND